MKLEFTADDFVNAALFGQQGMADRANKRLAEMLAASRRVFLVEAGSVAGNFIEADGGDATHVGRLVNVEEIE